MEVYQTIFEAFLYLFEGLIIFYYARNMFEQKFRTSVSITFLFLGYLVLFFVYKLDLTTLNMFAILVVNVLIFSFLYNCNFKTVLFHSFLLLCIMVACEWFSIFTISAILHKDFNAYQDNFSIHVMNIISSKLLYFIICILMVNFFAKGKKNGKSKSLFWVLLLMPLSTLIILLVFRYITFEAVLSNQMQFYSSIASGLLLATNIIVFFLYEYSVSNWEKLFELRAIQQKQELDETYLTILEQNNINLKIFTHDIKNHLEQISNLTQDSSIQKYITKLYGTIQKYDTIGASKNKILDIILSKYSTLCANKNIEISFNIKTANLSLIDDMDLSTILNNVLDNAVESALNSKKRKITVDIFTKQMFEIIKVKNSCDTPPQSNETKLLTSKKDKMSHGLGLISVQRTLKKYNGLFDWFYDDELSIFIVTIAIPKA